MNLSHYTLLADLFEYPMPGYMEKVEEVQRYLEKNDPEAFQTLSLFSHHVFQMSLKDIQELYSRSFDVQAATTLDVGYVLFGDDYKRGELLVNLNREHREVHNECGRELPDHLPNVLRLIAKLKDKNLVDELIREIMGPALLKMISDFDPKRLENREKLYIKYYKTVIEIERDKAIIFGYALGALYKVLKKDFSLVERVVLPATSEFLQFVNKENEIECTQ
ncbi:MAG: hypothetical protein HYS98_04700 [Deltaproteobacteria bacterium]|nr:hypothetical protein [Deltaproteobacteria bacterium]